MTKIAIVEDNPDNLLLFRAMLEDIYEVTTYETGPEALRGFQDEQPDLILLDISLPEMDGTEVLRRIDTDPLLRGIPVIALTAHAMAGDREAFLAAGFDEYITKPIIDEHILLDTIARFLAWSQPISGGRDVERLTMHDADSAPEPLLAELAALRQQHAALAAALADQQRAERESDARFRDLIEGSWL
jgi:two-component system, cell cycle response regulator DivK